MSHAHLSPAVRRSIRFIPAAVWMAVIFVLSARTGGELGSWLPFFQRFLPGLQSFDPMHYAAYFILALTLAYGLGPLSFRLKGAAVIMAVCIVYGATDEWHQSFVPSRTPDLLDLLHDALGAAAACLLFLMYRSFRPSRTRE